MLALAHGHSTRNKFIISISVGMILSCALVHATEHKDLTLKCTKRHEKFSWSHIYEKGKCEFDQHIVVTNVYEYNQKCDNVPNEANAETKKLMERICNGKAECTISELDTTRCVSNACYLLYFSCALHTEETASRTVTDKDVTTTQQSGTNDSSVDMYLVIIVVVSVLAFVTIVFAAMLCFLLFCCRKSPLYRRRTISHPAEAQQYQPEYDDVAENKFQTLTPSIGDKALHHGVLCVGAPVPSTSRAYENRITSDYDDYDEISSNESPRPAKRTMSASEISPSLPTMPLQSELSKSTRSNSRSPQLADKYNSLSSQQDRIKRSPLETPNEFTNTFLSSTSHTSKASSTDPTSPVNAEDSVSITHGDITIVEVQPRVYRASSPTSCLPIAEAGVYNSMLSVTGDYAHLARSGEEPRIMDNVYDG